MNAPHPETKSAPAPSAMSEGRAIGSSDPVSKIQAVLGNGVVLLPIPAGQKAPVIKGWNNTSLESMLDGRYLGSLLAGNIGVLLGKPSGNVCAIDIDDDTEVESFLDLNPRLRETLRTKGSRGCQLWVIPTDDEAPKSSKLTTKLGHPWGEWRADGNQSVIYGRHPKGMDYQWVVDAPAIEIAFDDIVWPDHLKVHWPDRAFRELVAEVGDPIAGRHINVSFFSRVFGMRHLVAVRRGELCIYRPNTGLWVQQSSQEMSCQVWTFVRRFLDEISAAEFKARLRQAVIDEIMGLLTTEGQRVPEASKSTFIHVKNGMLDVSQYPPVLLPFSPEYGSVQRVEIEYEPEASCSRFDAWLDGAMCRDDVLLLQEWFGAVMLGANYAHRMLLLSGAAGAGKTSLVLLLEELVGTAACCQLRTAQLGGRFEAREYANKRLLIGSDVQADFLTGRHTAILKSLTGGDSLTAERKLENEGVSFKGEFHMVICSNEELTLRVENDADAWERRLLSIEMNKPAQFVSVPDVVTVLLRDESEGILAWVAAGAHRHVSNGHSYALSTEQAARIQRIVDASDGVRLFVEQCLVLDESGQSEVTVEQLFDAYDEFAKRHDYSRLNKIVLGRKLKPLIEKRLGIHQRNDLGTTFLKPGGHLRGYKGLIVVP